MLSLDNCNPFHLKFDARQALGQRLFVILVRLVGQAVRHGA